MKKLLILLGLMLSFPMFSQYCVSYPIGIPLEINTLKAPSDYLFGQSKYKVVSFEVKAEGYPSHISLGNDLNNTNVKEYLNLACPDGCYYLITRMTLIDQSGQKTFIGGLEGPFLYMKYFKP